MNANALKALFADPTAYEIVEATAPRQRVALAAAGAELAPRLA